MPRKQLVRIGAAATAVDRSVSTLRRWEAEGRLTPERDAAGNRLYDLDDVRAVAAGERPAQRPAQRPAPRSPAPELRPRDAVSAALAGLDWGDDEDEDEAPNEDAPPRRGARAPDAPETRVRSARAAVEEARARRELEALEAESARDRARRDRAEHDARDRAATEHAERTRLSEVRALGYRYAKEQGAPLELLPDVNGDLAEWVTPARFPADLSADETAAQVRARVDRLLRPMRRAQERAREDAARERDRATRRAKVTELSARGVAWATLQVMGWHRDDRAAVLDEVRAALAGEVRADWTEADVIGLVGDVLDGWE